MPEMFQRTNRRKREHYPSGLTWEQEYQRELYEVLTGELRKTEEFRTITMENYLLDEIHNDLGFLVGDTIVALCEAQSTWNVILSTAEIFRASDRV